MDESAEESEDFEFSLDRLSAAYANVLERQQSGRDETLANPQSGDVTDSANDLDEQDDDAACPLNESTVLEALLFVGTPPDQRFTTKKLASLLRDVSPREIKQIVEQLNLKYQEQGSALRLITENGAVRLDLAPEMQIWKNKFQGEIREAELNQQAVDVMAIVAYNQPIGRKEIDSIRQRPSGAILTQLTQRELLEELPHPENSKWVVYRTTTRFLELFGLEQIEDLPQAQEADSIDDFYD